MFGRRFVLISSVLLAAFVIASAEVKREGDKITIRTKRQQCICIVVSHANQQLQCNCDNSQPGNVPQFQPEPTTTTIASTTTTEAPVLITTTTTSAPVYQTTAAFNDQVASNPCACVQIMVSTHGSQYSCDCNGAQSTGSNMPPVNFAAQDPATSTNFLTSALSQANYLGQQTQPQQQPPVVQPVPQYQPVQNYQSATPQNYLNAALGQSNYLANMVTPTQTVQPTYPTTMGYTPAPQRDPAHNVQFDTEPATTTCISILVPASGQPCLCGNNYIQCADNMCCHKRYRSHKVKEDDSAMDIIVDVLKNIKQRLDRN